MYTIIIRLDHVGLELSINKYQFIASYSKSTFFLLLLCELDLVNIVPLAAGTMLGFVSRECLEENWQSMKRKGLLFPGFHVFFSLLLWHSCQHHTGHPLKLTGTPAGGCLLIIPSPPTPQQTPVTSSGLQPASLQMRCESQPRRKRLF